MLSARSFVVLCPIVLLLNTVTLVWHHKSKHETESHVSEQYGAVIDAGSSGSRVRVLKWVSGRLSTMTVLDTSDSHLCNDVEPGVSHFGDNPKGAVKVLEPLFQCAKEHIPRNMHPYTPLLLFATAGVRLLPKTKQDELMSTIAQDACKQVPFVCKKDHFRVVSGAEEGVMLWLSINHLLGNFDSALGSKINLVGVLDMGGASTQIASSIFEETSGDSSEQIHVHVPDYITPRTVFSRSILGAGMMVAHQRVRVDAMERLAAEDNGFTDEDYPRAVFDPCSNDGYTTTLNVKDMVGIGQISERLKKWIGPDDEVQVRGTGNATECLRLTSHVVSQVASCDGENEESPAHELLGNTHLGFKHPHPTSRWRGCIFDEQPVPALSATSFYLVSNYFYVARFFRLGETVAIQEFVEHATGLCSMSWKHVVDLTRKNVHEPVEEYCFRALYLTSFLTHGLGFNPHDHVALHFVGTLQHNPTDWTLGAMLLDSHKALKADTDTMLLWLAFSNAVCFVLIIAILFPRLPMMLRISKHKTSPRLVQRSDLDISPLLESADDGP